VRLEILQGLSMMGKPSDPRLLAQTVNDLALGLAEPEQAPGHLGLRRHGGAG